TYASNHAATIPRISGCQWSAWNALGNANRRGASCRRRQTREISRTRSAARRRNRRGDAQRTIHLLVYATTDQPATSSAIAAETAVGLRRWLGTRRPGRLFRHGGRGAERDAAHGELYARSSEHVSQLASGRY